MGKLNPIIQEESQSCDPANRQQVEFEVKSTRDNNKKHITLFFLHKGFFISGTREGLLKIVMEGTRSGRR